MSRKRGLQKHLVERGLELLYLLDAEVFRAQDAILDDLRISKRGEV